jgi:hypothetical protein
MSADLERFYTLMRKLESLPEQGRRLSEYTGRVTWPARGVYFFREPGEYRASEPTVPRIVRVGTHALKLEGKSSLWSRLRAHRGGLDGRGNHRGSVFRLHVGAALLGRDGPELLSWGVGQSGTRELRAAEVEHERRVSAYIGAMTVLWVTVPDSPGPGSMRAVLERNAIALLSNRRNPPDPPSKVWLGRFSPKAAIRESGLWNLDHVDTSYDPSFLDRFEEMLTAGAGVRA